jgi:DNA polymerase-3 subunit alpha
LKEILDETYGIILYQEQVMMIANKIARFSMGQADILRRAMGKKKPEEMEKQKESFIKGAVGNGVPEKKAAQLFETMAPFAMYGFNKSHSAAYAYIAYQTAYLKAHYPVEFMAATLSTDTDNTDKIVKSIAECRKMSIEILPPDINESEREFKVIGKSIRFGLEAVKGVGSSAIEAILAARVTDGFFKTVEDFLHRMDGKKVNKKVIESLIKAGAFDSFGMPRAKALDMLSTVLNSDTSVSSLFAQQAIFDEGSGKEEKEWDEMELLRYEKEALGFYITGHPLSKYRESLSAMKVREISHLENVSDKEEVQIAGVVSSVKKIKTKGKAEIMAYLTIEDEEGSMEAIVFPDLYRNMLEVISKESVIVIKGTIDKTEKGIKLITREASRLDDFLSAAGTLRSPKHFPVAKNGMQRMEITLSGRPASREGLRTLKELISDYPGGCSLSLRIEVNGSCALMETALHVEPSSVLVERIEVLMGKGAVRIR